MSPSTLQFLTGLPAVLGIAGFVAYQLLRRQRQGDVITSRIIEKLRAESPDKLPAHLMRPRELHAWLLMDKRVRHAISEQDFRLLSQTLRQQHRESVIVYSMVCLMLLVSLVLYGFSELRPKPLELGDFRLESLAAEAKGLAVDVDTLRLSWEAEGVPEDIDIALQNVQTTQTTPWVHVSSQQHQVLLPPALYQPILSDREHGGFNRVRALARGSRQPWKSNEFRLQVGITVMAYFNHEAGELCVTALIDNRSIPYYSFEARTLAWTVGPDRRLISFGDKMYTPKTCFPVPDPQHVRWSELQVAYFGPDDDRMVRTTTLVDEEAIASRTSKTK